MKTKLFIVLLWALHSLAPSVLAESRADSNGLSLSDARHLLSRTGLGASPSELRQFIGLSQQEAVSKIISGFNTTPHSTLPEWTNNTAPHHYRFGTMPGAEKQLFRQARLSEMQSLRRWWIQEMISTPSPQTERLMLFWHNHFATAFSALNFQAVSVARQHMMLRKHATGNFRALLKDIIRDPAMLNYLDNNNSKKQKPNENLAREILELFTLGEGNYTEADIKNAARALTGYSFSPVYDMRFEFKHWTHDDGEKSIFGKTGNFTGDDLVDLILEQPAAATFIASKLWHVLVGQIEITDAALRPHASAFRNSDYDIQALYRSILLSNEFWHANNRAAIVQSPVSLSIGAIRSTGILPSDWQTLPSRLQQMGQHLFEPPNVAGWPGGATWIAPGRLLARLEWLEEFGSRQSLSPSQTNDMAMAMTSQSAAPATGAQQSTNMMMSSDNTTAARMASPVSPDRELSIRLAAEEFDEPAKYRVAVYGHNNNVWSSGVVELNGGHDTKRNGRAQFRNLPWQNISFPVNMAADEVNAIEVSFINDGTTPDGADRNLYVSRAAIGNRTWLPIHGKQTGKCARKQPHQQGNLYCPGTLRMEKSQANTVTDYTPLPANTLRTSSATLNFARPAHRKPLTDLVFTLSDVEFDGRFWSTLNVKYVKDKAGYALRLNSTDCWPTCFQQWPDCVWENPHSIKTVSFPLNDKKLQCMYRGLRNSDQKLVSALWMLLDDLYTIGRNDPKMQRPGVARNFNSWQAHIDEMLSHLPTTRYNKQAVKLVVAPRPIVDTTITENIKAPLPAGLTAPEWQKSLAELIKHQPELDFATLLLPTEPTSTDIGKDPPLSQILTDLAFQLK